MSAIEIQRGTGDGLALTNIGFLDWEPVTLQVGAAECVGVCGTSGSGKSLLLRAIVDLDENSGAVRLGDQLREETAAPEWRSWVGMLPAEPRWWEDLVGGHFRSMDEAGMSLLERLGFGREVLDWEVRRLSVGERQRLGLARLLQLKPKALMLDEPTANLDGENTRIVEEIVREYREARKAPVIWVSHDGEQIRRVAGRAFVMKDRRLRKMS
jgi:putative ABC transport system ATP-binding protein